MSSSIWTSNKGLPDGDTTLGTCWNLWTAAVDLQDSKPEFQDVSFDFGACAEHTASVDSGVAKISDDSLLGKVSRNFSTVLETRLEQQKNFSDSNLPQVSGNDSYQCTENVNKYKMPGSISDHTSTWKDDTFKEKPRIEATVLDLLGDDGPSSNGRSIPETHVALSVDGLGKIGCQTPAHSPRMQNRFSCKGISMESKASRQVRSTSALQSIYDGCNEELVRP
ncbi:hypothetical protein MA16_Dca003654 [Dendrobium catenatum]|uniref:Uncharacterized protein n=1 Tax=Dendrobium catenatum TaxID=906689 RepID=A0A2I0WFM1_9ASPA|nr:hypothetical protein MA16_Dca003654 [Dendrobium catenatum]